MTIQVNEEELRYIINSRCSCITPRGVSFNEAKRLDAIGNSLRHRAFRKLEAELQRKQKLFELGKAIMEETK